MEGVSADGVRWAVYDTFCKEFGPGEKARADREILDVFIRADQRKLIADRIKDQETAI